MNKRSVLLLASLLMVLTTASTYGQILPFYSIPGVPLATNEYGNNDGPVPAAPKGKFSIVVDPELHPQNFVSAYEYYMRTQVVKLDTAVFSLIKADWKSMTIAEKQEIMRKEAVHDGQLADSVHRVNNTANSGKQLVYFVNNTNDQVYLQMEDWQFMGVVEALDKNNQWQPIQYWQHSKCGDSYMKRPVKPNSSVVFIAPAINKGNYHTRLRYRVLGSDSEIYSNEFKASIDPADFERVVGSKASPLQFTAFAGRKSQLPITVDLK